MIGPFFQPDIANVVALDYVGQCQPGDAAADDDYLERSHNRSAQRKTERMKWLRAETEADERGTGVQLVQLRPQCDFESKRRSARIPYQ